MKKGNAVLSEDGSYVFTLAHGETITFHDIPYMTGYEVVELDGESNGYEVVAEAASGKIGEDDKDVLFIKNQSENPSALDDGMNDVMS